MTLNITKRIASVSLSLTNKNRYSVAFTCKDLALNSAITPARTFNVSVVPLCTDSDNGFNSFVRGSVTGGTGTILSAEDRCQGNFSITEYFCFFNKINSFDAPCEFGCENGACRVPICIDTDDDVNNGNNPLKAGYTFGLAETGSEDFCYMPDPITGYSDTLVEFYCNRSIEPLVYTCRYGCSEGRCLKKSEQIQPPGPEPADIITGAAVGQAAAQAEDKPAEIAKNQKIDIYDSPELVEIKIPGTDLEANMILHRHLRPDIIDDIVGKIMNQDELTKEKYMAQLENLFSNTYRENLKTYREDINIIRDKMTKDKKLCVLGKEESPPLTKEIVDQDISKLRMRFNIVMVVWSVPKEKAEKYIDDAILLLSGPEDFLIDKYGSNFRKIVALEDPEYRTNYRDYDRQFFGSIKQFKGKMDIYVSDVVISLFNYFIEANRIGVNDQRDLLEKIRKIEDKSSRELAVKAMNALRSLKLESHKRDKAMADNAIKYAIENNCNIIFPVGRSHKGIENWIRNRFEQPFCKDYDGGKNYGVPGFLLISNKQRATILFDRDYCNFGDDGMPTKELIEFYCKDKDPDYLKKVCEDKCIEGDDGGYCPEIMPEPGKSCEDKLNEYPPTCEGNTLISYECKPGKDMPTEKKREICTERCVDGECVVVAQAPEPIEFSPIEKGKSLIERIANFFARIFGLS